MITLGLQEKNTLLAEVNKRSGANVLECYQCGKCVSTCPVSQYMDFPPREIMQLIKLGQKETVYMANSTWFCLTCSACSGRCPRQIEIPAVMEAIRHIAIEENYVNNTKKVKSIRKFHNIFLDMIKLYGRSYELRLMAEHNIRTRDLFKDMNLAPVALLKGKIPLLVKPVKSIKAIRRMFKLADKLEKKHQ
ncbi:MAG: 4Fe-4S dicluster domain-containing protein [Bacteroidales bacterium]|nr:4Fe-4S dicluster domain-containing protein [Bacteroidales bacterium]MDD4603171.1 4Fe-4S dicluster domain-containing protein [Bacteroidales bacterium]